MKNAEHYARIETLESFVYKTQPIQLFTLPKKIYYKEGSGIDEVSIDLPVTNCLFQKISFDKPFIPIGIHHVTNYLLTNNYIGVFPCPSYIFDYKGMIIVTESDIDIDTHLHEVNWNKTILLNKYRAYTGMLQMYKYDMPENEMMPPGEYIFGMGPDAWLQTSFPEGLTIRPFEFTYLQKQ